MAGLSLNNSQCSSPTQCILSCTTGGEQAARGREGARENRRWKGQRERRREGREGREGREQGDGGRGNKGREGEKEGGREGAR